MTVEVSSQVIDHPPAEESELLDCLKKIGTGLIASGSAVGMVENTLSRIAQAYGVDCTIIALPNHIFFELDHPGHKQVEIAVQGLTTMQLDMVSELAELIDQVEKKQISLSQANQRIDLIESKKPRFGAVIVTIGYFLSCIGLTMLFRPDAKSLLISGAAGMLVGLIVLLFKWLPRFDLLLPVFSAIIVSTIIFTLTQMGYILGPANLLITPLILFLPGSLLTIGMIELASKQIISGSARLIYGATVLLLLFVGISVGLNLSGLAGHQVYAYEAVFFPWWAPILGTALFGVGTFIRLSGANRDLFWMLLVLYLAMLGQAFGEKYVNSYIGAFLGALVMALSSEIIARSPRRTPALVSQTLAFWFLVPGARGLLSVTNILSENIQGAAIGLGQVAVLVIAISLGVLLGTLLVSPSKFVPVSALGERFQRRKV
jgi:uncharacterized membrane protein YjjP (DUF1212 family)